VRYLASIIVVLASLLLLAGGAGNAQGDGVTRITPADAFAAVQRGKAIIVDVRGEDSYKAGHIKGALLIPINEIGSRTKELPRGKMIITYCAWPAEHSSARAVQIIKEKGFENGAALLGGYHAWINAGYATEKKW
jgi:rhodanese-related sulfurtransferase